VSRFNRWRLDFSPSRIPIPTTKRKTLATDWPTFQNIFFLFCRRSQPSISKLYSTKYEFATLVNQTLRLWGDSFNFHLDVEIWMKGQFFSLGEIIGTFYKKQMIMISFANNAISRFHTPFQSRLFLCITYLTLTKLELGCHYRVTTDSGG